MINELLLLSLNDIPFISAQVNIHQPTISEISLIGEEAFFSGCNFLNFSKHILDDKDKVGLEDKTDFDIFMSIMCSSEPMEHKNNAKMVLTLLFPDYQFKFTPSEILMMNDKGLARINNTNFEEFKKILVSMFGLNDAEVGGGYNPVDRRAAKIAEKLQKAKDRKLQAQGKTKQKIAILSRYISVLTVGESKDMNTFLKYNVFQLKDEFKRYQMKFAFDINLQARMAGASDVEDVDNWMDDIHP